MTARYAVYFAPAPTSDLWRLASAVIGRDAVTGAAVAFPAEPPCDGADWGRITADPRRYGFHATLKAPFELVDGVDGEMLRGAARAFAADRVPFVMPRLAVRTMGDFVALTPEAPNADLQRLAADAVVAFEPFRAPLDAFDRARRVASLTEPRHVAAVDRWGYPWVFEDFRFHMTLTGRLVAERREPVRAALAALFTTVDLSVPVDAITLFEQPERSAPFRVMETFPFRGE